MFALWMTGRPASGKSTLTAELVRALRARGVDPAVLESDVFRRFFTPHPTYSEEERNAFYQGLVEIGVLLADRGVPVIFDATANRRAYREHARERIRHFVEVFVDCPRVVGEMRDRKGLYRKAREGGVSTLPGVQVEYEAPLAPEVHIHSDRESPDVAIPRIIEFLDEKGYLPQRRHRHE